MSDRAFMMQSGDNIFPEEQRKTIDDYLRQSGWEHGWKSNANRDVYSFLHKHFAGQRKTKDKAYDCESELLLAAPPIWTAWRDLRERWFQNAHLVRCYANGMAYGMEGTVHTDASTPGNLTVVYYPHDRWSPNWGGETIFYNQAEDTIIGCRYPRPNSAVIFDGRIPHRAAGVTRLYPGLRITLMFKVERDEPETPKLSD